jgi:hypothetical protein
LPAGETGSESTNSQLRRALQDAIVFDHRGSTGIALFFQLK